MATATGPVVLVGGGKMGGALLAGWLDAGVPAATLHVVEPDPTRRDALAPGASIGRVAAAEDLPAGLRPAALVLAVKPQVMDEVAPRYRGLVGTGTLVLSIAAGKIIAAFERVFGAEAAIVRAMPNTPAAVGRGATVLCANGRVGPSQRDLAERLMRAVGETHWVEDEELLHAVTALSGGGPAYVFLLIETLAEAGRRLGLPGDLAMRLARATVVGSGELARQSPAPASRLREDVTSPGGTTQAALRVLMAEDGIRPLFDRALEAAVQRSRELGRGADG